MILTEKHDGFAGGHYARKATKKNILHAGLWFPTLHKEAEEYCKSCDVFQRLGRPSKTNEIPLNPQVTLQEFEKWAMDFPGSINPPARRTRARYVITMIDYLTIWIEVEPVIDCNMEIIA
jgi:hypothetical protein